MEIINYINQRKKEGIKMLAFLVDPDKAEEGHIQRLCELAKKMGVDLFLVGGSLLTDGDLDSCIQLIKKYSKLPVVIFPGSPSQISSQADAILFLSLLSSRNPEMLIGQQVIAAPYLKKSSLEVIGTAYLLIEGGKQTTASYISNSNPIPADKSDIAAYTALAGQYMGMKLAYLDAGSGALNAVPTEMIRKVRSKIDIPLVVGGGIKSKAMIAEAYKAGADMVVIGNALEKGIQIFE